MASSTFAGRLAGRTAVGALLLVAGLAGVPASAQPGAPVCVDLGAALACAAPGVNAGSVTTDYYDPSTGAYMGWTRVTTYSNTRNKLLQACDSRSDSMSPALWIDPLGAGPPDTLLYFDPDGNGGECLNRTIGYDVRKWSPAIEQGGQSITEPDWRLHPFPPCPPCTPA
ncbi:hypothetical protein ACFV4N_31975 [Actinosynnema sp. NPDC059797]